MHFNKKLFICCQIIIFNLIFIIQVNSLKSLFNINQDKNYKKPIAYIKINTEKELVDSLSFSQLIGKRVSIRSGGHSSCSFSLINDTINLDLSGLKGIRVDKSSKVAFVKSGVLLDEYYNEISRYGLGSTGGMCGSVGIGGIALGGGSNFISPKFGYLVDNILEFKILLANGDIIFSNPFNKYKDLFWALSGSGHGGFGIILEYKIQLHNIQPFYYTNVLNIPIQFVAQTIILVDNFINSTENLNRKLSFNIISSMSTIDTNPAINLSFFFIDGSIEEGEIEFRKLLKLLPWAKLNKNFETNKTFMEIVELAPKDNNQNIREITKSRFIKHINITTAYAFQDFIYFTNSLVKTVKNNDTVTFSNQFYYHGGNHLLENEKSSFIHRCEESKYSVVFYCQYLKGDSDKNIQLYKDNLKKYLPIFGDKIYQNYPDDEISNWQSSYYGNNYKKLQEIKKKYDPLNYFKNEQSIELP
ncbi:hypothetical protein RB653_000450 [Dictyostelium firmibasis]|uniref:FAD-binding PCMH-type domain-containing protein n=1 Tax=Dictyostelium firmibasis TaxID=79012 RepID=A0AAN7U2R8_9MYCE